MSRNKPYSAAALLTMLTALAAVVVMVACAPAARTVDLTTVSPCPVEDGPGMVKFAPCVWDSQTRGNGRSGVYGVRWLYYSADNSCPTTVQDTNTVRCVRRLDWDGS